jgi:hypothetical protein
MNHFQTATGGQKMENELQVNLECKNHPDSRHPGAPFELWGRIRIDIIKDGKVMPLLDWQWDLYLLAEWFSMNHRALRHQQLSIGDNTVENDESLAQALARL